MSRGHRSEFYYAYLLLERWATDSLHSVSYIFHLMDFIEMKNQTKHEWYKFSLFFPSLPLALCCCFVCNMIKIVLIRFCVYLFHTRIHFSRSIYSSQIDAMGKNQEENDLPQIECILSYWLDLLLHQKYSDFYIVDSVDADDDNNLLRFRVPFPISPFPCCIAFRTIWWSPAWPSPIPCTVRSVQINRRVHICRFVVVAVVRLHRMMVSPCHHRHCHSHALVGWNDRIFRCWN